MMSDTSFGASLNGKFQYTLALETKDGAAEDFASTTDSGGIHASSDSFDLGEPIRAEYNTYAAFNMVESYPTYLWVAFGGAVVSVIVACALSFWLIYQHLKFYRQPRAQQCVMRILLMVPVYAVLSCISLLWRKQALIFDLVRDSYEAYVVYFFMVLMLRWANAAVRLDGKFAYIDGEENIVALLDQKPRQHWICPCCCCGYFDANRRWLHIMEVCVLQFIVIKPLGAVVSIILHSIDHHLFEEGHFAVENGFTYVTIVEATSIFAAMFCLLQFYMVIKDHLAPFKPVDKLMAIKAIILVAFIQSILITGAINAGMISDADYSVGEMSTGLQDLLICYEMCLVAIWHIKVFDYKEYLGDGGDDYGFTVKSAFMHAMHPRDVLAAFRPAKYRHPDGMLSAPAKTDDSIEMKSKSPESAPMIDESETAEDSGDE